MAFFTGRTVAVPERTEQVVLPNDHFVIGQQVSVGEGGLEEL